MQKKTLSDYMPRAIELNPYQMRIFRNFTSGRKVDGRAIKQLLELDLIQKTRTGYRRTLNAGIPRIG